MRHDGRKAQELRKLELQTNVFKYPEGSVVIRFGDTTVICSATIENSVPPFLRETGTGWGQQNIVCCLEQRVREIVEKAAKGNFLVEQWKSSVLLVVPCVQ